MNRVEHHRGGICPYCRPYNVYIYRTCVHMNYFISVSHNFHPLKRTSTQQKSHQAENSSCLIIWKHLDVVVFAQQTLQSGKSAVVDHKGINMVSDQHANYLSTE